MRLAALYSGGKDSTFAMYTMFQMGHEIACLVNIKPSGDSSWIFHTPNQDIVPLMAEAMDLALVTAVTPGTEEGDMNALKEALGGLDVEGVVTGAVWSDYQWDRINRVCGSLELTVFSPMWRKDQDMMLDEVIASGVEAVIIGCYAEGLDSSWLGRRLDSKAAEELRAIRAKTGISVIGEGGEYETLTLNSPMHRHALEIVSSEVEWRKGSGTLHVRSARLRP
ncbi:MAG: diphthine--ammonia ligase [Candidatus Methanomethylophilaceae archaeon]|nr:diphthine--ammonia ligase [Candidatus Methanomethylophilaceae archaeon]